MDETRTPRLELAIQDHVAVTTARSMGADRVELCSALGSTGGVTPSQGLVELTVEAARPSLLDAPLGVHVLVRPRPGGFVYDVNELELMEQDVRAARAAGADGVVVGALRIDGSLDTHAMRVLVDAAAGAAVTFHRAFDVMPDLVEAIDVLAGLGVTRVLTSGGALRAVTAVDRFRRLVLEADGRIEIMAGGGVQPEDVPVLLGAGVDAVHLSARRVVVDDGGPGGGSATGYDQTDGDLALAAGQAFRQWCESTA
ncbi:CutC family protein [Beutenbergia cavernae DSM 12333]|uniref:PF03932 family protein CutC n=1 Tax=Beutenbergia cavernae (strain ATCC BAA-8 / DSM 12333 / CCUG 43141 / JCM 11478 / NBRC 16432 / NCIMB 13614 / HKI 0122) TaxID=471853 RepID=C5C5F1_BEUC1|nr:copper homeostasis protein CutC [Beutenbergia cavernae]ACQ82291.1 CutC family protein [Beutenbergia cavernae DSM 12333]